jgi:hypothetical protein
VRPIKSRKRAQKTKVKRAPEAKMPRCSFSVICVFH